MQTVVHTGCVVVLATCFSQIPSAQDLSSRKGHLVNVGGGGLPDVVAARALALSGGAAARVAAFAQASELTETGQDPVDFWKKAGALEAVEVNLPDLAAATAARSIQEPPAPRATRLNATSATSRRSLRDDPS